MISAGFSLVAVSLALFGLVAMFDIWVARIGEWQSRVILAMLGAVALVGLATMLVGLAVLIVT